MLAVLSKKKTVAETCREQAVDGMEQALSDKFESSRREHVLEKKLSEVHFPTVVVHPFRLKLYNDSDVVVHPGRS